MVGQVHVSKLDVAGFYLALLGENADTIRPHPPTQLPENDLSNAAHEVQGDSSASILHGLATEIDPYCPIS